MKLTPLVPCDIPRKEPKFSPSIVTTVPSGPELDDREWTDGSPDPESVTVKATPLLACPLTVTTTLPVIASVGTGTRISSSLQLLAEVHTPLKLTPPMSTAGPNLEPRIVTVVPSGPRAGLTVPMAGPLPPVPVTVNSTPLLARPLTVTTTSPVTAPGGTATWISLSLQLVGEAHAPLKLTPLVPCTDPIDGPKLEPPIVTTIPSGPDSGVTESIAGSVEPDGRDPCVAAPHNASNTAARIPPARLR